MDFILGKSIKLRYVRPSDASFILSLRLDDRRNKYLSPVEPDVKKQRAWIEKYQSRESEGTEHYFIIETLDGVRQGTVRIYDFKGDSFSWGSWLLSDSAPTGAAIESALAVYDFAFNELGFSKCHFQVSRGNDRVIAFHKRLGAVETASNDDEFEFTYSRDTYESIRPRYSRYLPSLRDGRAG